MWVMWYVQYHNDVANYIYNNTSPAYRYNISFNASSELLAGTPENELIDFD